MSVDSKLSNVQLELLKLFSMNLNDKQLLEIKSLLTEYLANNITDEMDNLFENNKWGEEKIQEWKNEHMRTKYDRK